MSGARDYIAWSLLTAGLVTAVGWAIGIATRKFGAVDSWHASKGRRLQRRLDRRLARGEDNYFEELRSIETAIAQHQANTVPGAPQRFKTANDVLTVLYVFWLGFVLVQWLGKSLIGIEAPAWAEDLGLGWMPVFGVQQILASFDSNAYNALGSRILGFCILAMGAFVVGTSVMHRLGGHAS